MADPWLSCKQVRALTRQARHNTYLDAAGRGTCRGSRVRSGPETQTLFGTMTPQVTA